MIILIKNVDTNFYMEVVEAGNADIVNIRQHTCNSSFNQQFSKYKKTVLQ